MDIVKRQNGFTLLEIIITVAIIGLLTAVAVPAIKNFMPGYNLNGATRDIFTRFKETRMAAITRNTTCSISFNAVVDGQNFIMIAYTDPDGDRRYSNDGQHVILGSITPEQYDYVTWDPDQWGGVGSNFPDNGIGQPSFSWSSRGWPMVGNAPVNGTVSLKNSLKRQVDILVSRAGNVRIQQN